MEIMKLSDDEKILAARAEDYVRRALERGIPAFTDFLSDRERAIVLFPLRQPSGKLEQSMVKCFFAVDTGTAFRRTDSSFVQFCSDTVSPPSAFSKQQIQHAGIFCCRGIIHYDCDTVDNWNRKHQSGFFT